MTNPIITSPDLPPNQHLAVPGKWPSVGEKEPEQSARPWRLDICGLVENSLSWSLEEMRSFPQVERVIDIHCVTRWSKPGALFSGVELATLLNAAKPKSSARFVSFVARSSRSHSTSLVLQDALDLGVLIALAFEGAPLSSEHGGPIRSITPGRYFYKSLKWLERIELLEEDRPGYWEAVAGYHNHADPWLEERYIAPNLDRKTLKEALDTRDFSGRDLRSLDAARRDLSGLNARHSLLRDANFQHATLCGAVFDDANLSNAHLQGANLQGASFLRADVEGAEFEGADLRGADFTGASLFGATFYPETEPYTYGFSLVDSTTKFDELSLAALSPAQLAFIRKRA